jgi:hypothetical protein
MAEDTARLDGRRFKLVSSQREGALSSSLFLFAEIPGQDFETPPKPLSAGRCRLTISPGALTRLPASWKRSGRGIPARKKILKEIDCV